MQFNIEFFIFVAVFVFGAIIGSFLNVVLYRFHAGRSLNGRSHCMSCGHVLHWYELLPLVSYITQRGTCRACDSQIPIRYLVVELLTGLLFVLVYYVTVDSALLLLYFFLMSLFVLIIVYDIRHTIIPDEFTATVFAVSVAYILYEYSKLPLLTEVMWHLVSGLVAAGFFWILWYMSKGRWLGFGDVKLAVPLGIMVGISGVFSMIVLSFWIGAAISLTLLALQRLLKRGKTRLRFLSTTLTIKSEVPFAPFLIAGFFLVHFVQLDIFTIIYALFFRS